ncbi:MAG TPA: glycosyltransferase, partial [Pyrinomonadaceae bacterium]|nr:glycosyltransferase [Pyrinomonadaceae bacterium]
MPGTKIVKTGISAIVTAYERVEQTLATLKVIHSCQPSPDEVLVHVDANQVECERAVREAFPNVRIMLSSDRVGPGGGRNKLVEAAQFELVASFDDDSYPIDSDYFSRASELCERFPEASVICA